MRGVWEDRLRSDVVYEDEGQSEKAIRDIRPMWGCGAVLSDSVRQLLGRIAKHWSV